MADSSRKPCALPPPSGSEARTVVVDGQPFLVISHPAPGFATLAPSLTPTEREVVLGLLWGQGSRAIARVRGVSLRTVENQIASIYRKLGVRSRGELVGRLAPVPDRAARAPVKVNRARAAKGP